MHEARNTAALVSTPRSRRPPPAIAHPAVALDVRPHGAAGTPSFAGEGSSGFAQALSLGIGHALAYLNRGTRFRFTTLYRLERGVLRGAAIHDRENPAMNCAPPPVWDALPGPPISDQWMTAMSQVDVTLRLLDGAVVGRISHSDERPRLLAPSQRALLEQVALDLAFWLAESAGEP